MPCPVTAVAVDTTEMLLEAVVPEAVEVVDRMVEKDVGLVEVVCKGDVDDADIEDWAIGVLNVGGALVEGGVEVDVGIS